MHPRTPRGSQSGREKRRDESSFVAPFLSTIDCFKARTTATTTRTAENRQVSISKTTTLRVHHVLFLPTWDLKISRSSAMELLNTAPTLASHADVLRDSSRVRGAGTRDEPLRTPAWKTTQTFSFSSSKLRYGTFACTSTPENFAKI